MNQQITKHLENNDELTNYMISLGYIRSHSVENVFRSVDRGFFLLNYEKPFAYLDIPSKVKPQIILSAPGVYALTLEYLQLQRGQKFLNIGSGNGYFNILAGLLLGENGINHCIEINHSVIEHAIQKIEEFKLHSAAIDYFNFCEPVFTHGNACDLTSNGKYDRIYCGASIQYETCYFLKSLLKIGGIVIMVSNNHLVKVTRLNDYTWRTDTLLTLRTNNLDLPNKSDLITATFSTVEPSSLKNLCRFRIRSILRNNLLRKYPNLRMKCYVMVNNYNPPPYIYIGNKYNECEEHLSISDLNYYSSLIGLRRIVNAESEELVQNFDLASAEEIPVCWQEHATYSKKIEKTSKETENLKINMSNQNLSESLPQHNYSLQGSMSLPSSLFHENKNYSTKIDEEINKKMDGKVIKKNGLNDMGFMTECKNNELSLLLKSNINSLSLNYQLKNFLNYYRTD